MTKRAVIDDRLCDASDDLTMASHVSIFFVVCCAVLAALATAGGRRRAGNRIFAAHSHGVACSLRAKFAQPRMAWLARFAQNLRNSHGVACSLRAKFAAGAKCLAAQASLLRP